MILFTIKQTSDGLWEVRRDTAIISSELGLSAAVKSAREAARDEHLRSGRPTCVQTFETGVLVKIASYPQRTHVLPMRHSFNAY